MRSRPAPAPERSTSRGSGFTVDVIIVKPQGRQLAVLMRHSSSSGARAHWELPWDVTAGGERLEDAAQRIVRTASRTRAAWIDQVGAFADGHKHPASSVLSVAFVALMADGGESKVTDKHSWIPVGQLPTLLARQRAILDSGLSSIRHRMDHAPVAFRLLPEQFTLGELQQAYELLLGRRLHKASFRRALQASYLVVPTDEWRSEGRGRPAQLFRYAPRRRKNGRRPVRFDLLG